MTKLSSLNDITLVIRLQILARIYIFIGTIKILKILTGILLWIFHPFLYIRYAFSVSLYRSILQNCFVGTAKFRYKLKYCAMCVLDATGHRGMTFHLNDYRKVRVTFLSVYEAFSFYLAVSLNCRYGTSSWIQINVLT